MGLDRKAGLVVSGECGDVDIQTLGGVVEPLGFPLPLPLPPNGIRSYS